MTNAFTKRFWSVALIAVLAIAMLFVALGAQGAVAAAEEEPEMIFEQTVVVGANPGETSPGSRVLRSVAVGNTFTITYALTKNDGMAEGIFTPAYDKNLFYLTSFTVDPHWTLVNAYGKVAVEDPITHEITYRQKTAAEAIAEYNAALADNQTPPRSRLTFDIAAEGVDPEENEGDLSDAFITIVYTARVAFAAPDALGFSFGFNMSNGGLFTNAATDSADLLLLKLSEGGEEQAFSANMCSFRLMAETEIAVDEGQTIRFHKNGADYALDTDDIAVTFIKPEDEDPYFDDGGEVTFVFYEKVDNEYVPIVPTEPRADLYVRATAAGTTHYDGDDSDYESIIIAPYLLTPPALQLEDNQHDDPAVLDETTLTISDAVVYGATLDLTAYSTAQEEYVAFPSEQEAEQYTITYWKKSGEDYVAYGADPLAAELLPVGEYRVIITPVGAPCAVFAGANSAEIASIEINVTVTPKTLTIAPKIDGDKDSLTVTYGAAAIDGNRFSVAYDGILEVGDARSAIIEAINAEVYSDAPYAQYGNVGTYYYAVKANGASADYANYTVVCADPATIVVEKKALTLSVQYEGGVATFSVEGLLLGETPVYSVGGTALAGSTYTAKAADLGNELTVTVLPATNANNYAADSKALLPFYQVTFDKGGELYAAATGVPAEAQYVFRGCLVTAPAEDPVLARYAFLYWRTEAGAEYDFTATVESTFVLYAEWDQTEYAFRFRALNASASYATGSYLYLNWNAQENRFEVSTDTDAQSGELVAADSSEAFDFTKNTVIPMAAAVKSFRVNRWLKVVNGVYTETAFFDPAASIETDADAYYLAEMVLDVGMGDVDGNGEVNVLDILSMRRYLVDAAFVEIETEADAWNVVLRDDTQGDYFFLFAWDANGDKLMDTRDVLTIRETLATGYGYEIVTNKTTEAGYCLGAQIVREDAWRYVGQAFAASDLEELAALLNEGKRVVLTADILAEEPINEEFDGDIFIDLGGKTITGVSLILHATGKITILNGKLVFDNVYLGAENKVYVFDVLISGDYPVEYNGVDACGW